MKLENIKFTTYLAIISVLGFLTIFLQNLIGVDISVWVESMLFLLIGFSLFVSGGYKLIFSYFKGGLTIGEINRIVSVVVGVASMFVGLLTVPLIGLEIAVIPGIKIVISLVAIIVIIFEALDQRSCKR